MKASKTATAALIAGTMLLAGACGPSDDGDDQAAATTAVQKFDTVRPAITEAPTTSAPAPAGANPPTMSRAEFEQITEGMTLAEVVEIVGGPGEIAGSPNAAGLDRYRWESDCGPGLGFWGYVIVQNGAVVSATETLGPDDQEQCRAMAVRAALSDAGYGPLADGTDDAALAALGVSTCEVAQASPSIEAFIPEVQAIEGLGASAQEQGAMARALMAVYCPADFERLMG